MSSSNSYRWILVLAALICVIPQAYADASGNLLSPGPVINRHAKYESECSGCHKHFDKTAQPGLCKRCHREVAQDELNKHGLHGRHRGKNECRECHHEHKGRDVSLIQIDTKHFDHGKQTGVELKGRHASKKVRCRDCHFPRVAYREVKKTCNGCHAKRDKHKGALGKECQSCHEEKSWKTLHFVHNKNGFLDSGKHRETKCVSCHKGNLYRSKSRLKTDCFSCHKKDDKHKGQEGKKCESCHTPHSWKKAKFDHRMSRFALTGLHTLVACNKCHLTAAFKDSKSDCWSCHEKQDVHLRRLGTDCETCHNTRNWAGWDFNHEYTGFKLRNRHAALKCIRCHDAPVKRIRPNARCGACHGNEDSHDGAYGEKCDQCHTDLAWRNIKVGSTEFFKQDSGKRPSEKTVSNKQKRSKKNRQRKERHY